MAQTSPAKVKVKAAAECLDTLLPVQEQKENVGRRR